MGMFDEFILDERLMCPACNTPHIDALQTKSLPDRSLRHFRVGDRMEFNVYDGEADLHISSGWVQAYEWCTDAAAMVYYKVHIEDSKFVRVEFDRIWERDR